MSDPVTVSTAVFKLIVANLLTLEKMAGLQPGTNTLEISPEHLFMQKAKKLSVTPGIMLERLRNEPQDASTGQKGEG